MESPDNWNNALRPIMSLIDKSEKARRKLKAGTWQHAMLGDNLNALRLAVSLMGGGGSQVSRFKREDLREAARAFTVMISRTENARVRFAPGTSQESLLRNRLNALRVAEKLLRETEDGAADLDTPSG